jgi:phage-related protein
MEQRRKIFFYGNHYHDLYKKLDNSVKKKIDWVLGIICELEIVPTKFLKHLEGTNGLYEIRVQVRRNIYRIFCFFDEGKLIVVLHGFQKKIQKTPKNEITKAEKLKKEYYEQK